MTASADAVYAPAPDAIDTRFVLRVYAGLALSAGLYTYLWPAWAVDAAGLGPMSLTWGVPWSGHGIVRSAAAMVVTGGMCALSLTTIDDPLVRRRALLRFAIAHLALGCLWLLQWTSIFEHTLSAAVPWSPHAVWLPLILGAALLYVAITTQTALPDRRAATTYELSHGLFHDRASRPTVVLLSQYGEQIRRAAQQEERARLARDLHDAVKQQLFVIQTAAATAEARLGDDHAGTRNAIEQIRSAARDATTEMQAMIEQLQAAPLENTGLAEALKKQSEALGLRTGAEVRVHIGDLPPSESLPPGTQQAVFRAAQEALANIGRHARAHHVSVSLGASAEQLCLTISDDGSGFEGASTPRGMGIKNMMARARELGGSFSLRSAPGQGTTVEIAVPYSLPSPWAFGRQALMWAALLLIMLFTWRRSAFDPMNHIVATLAVIAVARNVVAFVRLRRRAS